jgi:peptide deformylase
MINVKDFPRSSEQFLRQSSELIKTVEEAKTAKDKLLYYFPESNAHAVAYPQIGVLKQATLIRLPSTKEFLLMCNPEIVSLEDEFVYIGEGCLSFPKTYLNTKRFRYTKVKYHDEQLEERLAVFEGIEAIIVQHEYDHLNGVLFFDRENKIEPMRRSTPKIGRNDPCTCGSGLKWKRCHGR